METKQETRDTPKSKGNQSGICPFVCVVSGKTPRVDTCMTEKRQTPLLTYRAQKKTSNTNHTHTHTHARKHTRQRREEKEGHQHKEKDTEHSKDRQRRRPSHALRMTFSTAASNHQTNETLNNVFYMCMVHVNRPTSLLRGSRQAL